MDEVTSECQGHTASSLLFNELRVLAAENPKEARIRVCRAIDDRAPELGDFLKQIG